MISLLRIKIFIIPAVIGIIIATLLPEDILQSENILKDYYFFVHSWMPWIEHQSKYSSFPSITSVYLAIAWPMLLLQSIGVMKYLRNTVSEASFVNAWKSNSNKLMLTKTIGIPRKYWLPLGFLLIDLILVFGFYLGEDPSFCQGCANNSRIGMAIIWSFLMPLSIGMMIEVQFIWLKNFRKLYLI